MENNTTYKILVSAIIVKDGKILISQRDHKDSFRPGEWTVPGGKVENYGNVEEIENIVEKTLIKEVREEVGVEIKETAHLIANYTFKHKEGHIMLALVFMCEYLSGTAQPLEDTAEVRWITANELSEYNFPETVHKALAKTFALIPYRPRTKAKPAS